MTELLSELETRKKGREADFWAIARKLAAAEQAHTEATTPLHARLDAIRTGLRDAEDARQRLLDTCPYADLKTELADVTDRLAKQRNRVTELRCEAERRAREAETDVREAKWHAAGFDPSTNPARAPEWRERAERNHRAAEKAKAELPGVEREMAKLEREEAAIYERMVKP